jgi:hypothetical protein
VSLLIGALRVALRGRQALALLMENLLLRQQLAVALRTRARGGLRRPDRQRSRRGGLVSQRPAAGPPGAARYR